MEKEKIVNYLMLGLGAALTLGSSLVNARNQDKKMEETITKKVSEALANQAKES